MSRTASVSFEARGGRWRCNAAGDSAFEAVRKAWRFFQDPFWKGPKPTLETVFCVEVSGPERKIFVRASKALEKE